MRIEPSPGNNVLSKSRILSVGTVKIVIYKQIQLERSRDVGIFSLGAYARYARKHEIRIRTSA